MHKIIDVEFSVMVATQAVFLELSTITPMWTDLTSSSVMAPHSIIVCGGGGLIDGMLSQ